MLELLVFLLAVHIGVQTIAACFAPIDLAFELQGRIVQVGGRLGLWWFLTAGSYWLLNPSLKGVFALGLLTALAGFVGSFLLLRCVSLVLWRRNNLR